MSKLNTFTAIDFETAQGPRYSNCSIGLVHIVNGKVAKQIDLLVQPPDNYYFYKNIEIHGISPEMTKHSPTFEKIWHEIEPYIRNQNVVAHNAAFDMNCLEKVLEYYELEFPEFNSHCTYKIYGSALAPLCDKYKIKLEHHNALSDAMACAQLFMIHQQNNN